MKQMALYVFCFIFFVVSWWLSVTPTKLVNRIGKVITPVLLLSWPFSLCSPLSIP